MQKLAGDAGGTGGVDAAEVDFAFGLVELGVADGAVGGKDDVLRAARMLPVVDDFSDLGDDVAAALDGNEVADADAETADLVGVVKCGAGDGDAADVDGSERGDGSDFAGAADLEEDVERAWVVAPRAANL